MLKVDLSLRSVNWLVLVPSLPKPTDLVLCAFSVLPPPIPPTHSKYPFSHDANAFGKRTRPPCLPHLQNSLNSLKSRVRETQERAENSVCSDIFLCPISGAADIRIRQRRISTVFTPPIIPTLTKYNNIVYIWFLFRAIISVTNNVLRICHICMCNSRGKSLGYQERTKQISIIDGK